MHKFSNLSVCVVLLWLLSPLLLAKDKVLVVGAGIIGSSIAYHLSQENIDVTVIDMQEPASHASLGTFAWINASWAKQPKEYHSLNQQSVDYWHSLAAQLDIPVKWGGSLEWFASVDRQQKLSQHIQQQKSWGEASRMISSVDGQNLQPNVNFLGTQTLAYSQNDGAVDPRYATHKLLSAARKNGALVKYPCKLESVIKTSNSKVANTSCGSIAFDKIVMAVGAASEVIKKIAKIDIPQRTTPGIIVITKPIEPLLNKIIVAPGVHIHQRLDGRIVLGEQAGAPKTQAHTTRLAGRPNQYPNDVLAQQHAQRIIAIALKYVPQLVTVVVEDVFIGWRPLPIDGHPVLGFSTEVPDVYVAVTHSGVTLAPIIGRLVTQELVSNKQLNVLNSYRPNRLFKNLKRY